MRVVVNPDGALDMEPAGNVATVEDRSKKSLRHFSLRHGGNIISRLINLLMRGGGALIYVVNHRRRLRKGPGTERELPREEPWRQRVRGVSDLKQVEGTLLKRGRKKVRRREPSDG